MIHIIVNIYYTIAIASYLWKVYDYTFIVDRNDWIKWYGIKYAHGDYILCGLQDDDLPMFGKIEDILLIKNHCFLHAKLFFTKGIHHHFSSYIIEQTTKSLLVSINNNKYFAFINPMYSHVISSIPGTIFIVTKLYIVRM